MITQTKIVELFNKEIKCVKCKQIVKNRTVFIINIKAKQIVKRFCSNLCKENFIRKLYGLPEVEISDCRKSNRKVFKVNKIRGVWS